MFRGDRVVPQAVVVDTEDGFTFYRGKDGKVFTVKTAREFAAERNLDRKLGEWGFRVFFLEPDHQDWNATPEEDAAILGMLEPCRLRPGEGHRPIDIARQALGNEDWVRARAIADRLVEKRLAYRLCGRYYSR